MWNEMGCKKGVKNPKLPKIRPAIPVQVSLYRFLHWLYRYRLELYRYTCSNFSFFFSFLFFYYYFLYGSIFIFLQIGNNSVDVKSILVDYLPSQVSLHAHLSPYSYSAQTDCVHGVDNCTSFFRHFHTYHGPTVFLVIRVPRVLNQIGNSRLKIGARG